MQESVIDYEGPVLIEPLDCLAAKAAQWFRAGFKHAGVHPRMGLRLFGLMRAAGLDPSMEIDMSVPIQQGPDGTLFSSLTSVVRSQIRAIVASGAATEAEIDIETLEKRLIADAPEAVLSAISIWGTWAYGRRSRNAPLTPRVCEATPCVNPRARRARCRSRGCARVRRTAIERQDPVARNKNRHYGPKARDTPAGCPGAPRAPRAALR